MNDVNCPIDPNLSQMNSMKKVPSHRIMSDLVGFGWNWSDIDFWLIRLIRSIWSGSVGFGQIWSDLVGFGPFWSDLVGFGRNWSDFDFL